MPVLKKVRFSLFRFLICTTVLLLAFMLLSVGVQLYEQTERSIRHIEENTVTVALEQFPIISTKTEMEDGRFYMSHDTQVSAYDAWQKTLQSSAVRVNHYGSFCTAFSDALYPVMPGLRGRLNAHNDYQYAENMVLLRVKCESDIQDNVNSYLLDMKVLEVLWANDPATVTDTLFTQCFVYGKQGEILLEKGKTYVVMGRISPKETVNLGSIRTIKGNTKSRIEEILGPAMLHISFTMFEGDTLKIQHDEYGEVSLYLQDENFPLIVEEGDSRIDVMKQLVRINSGQLWISAVQQLEYVPYFATGDAYITHGRTFTAEENASSAQVCVVSGTFAQKNKLNIGDRIDLTFYDNYTADGNHGSAGNFWQIYPYDSIPEAAGQGTYEIIGFYNAPEWQYGLSCFSPNTIFVPKNCLSCIADLIQDRMSFTNSVILHNGKTREFLNDATAAGMEGWAWRVYDNGYTSYMNALENMKQDTLLVLLVCILVFIVLVLSAVGIMSRHLHQDAQMMYRIGATKRQTSAYILACLLPVAILAAAAAYGVHCMLHSPLNALMESWYTQQKPAYSTATTTIGLIRDHVAGMPSVTGCLAALAFVSAIIGIYAIVHHGGKAVKA